MGEQRAHESRKCFTWWSLSSPQALHFWKLHFTSPFEFISLHIISKNMLIPLCIEHLIWSRERAVSLMKMLDKLLFVYWMRGRKRGDEFRCGKPEEEKPSETQLRERKKQRLPLTPQEVVSESGRGVGAALYRASQTIWRAWVFCC